MNRTGGAANRSKDSWLIQLADCVVYLRNRYEKAMMKLAKGEALHAGDEEIVSLWRDRCVPRVVSDKCWP